jgi:RHS repeat-associated protein
LLGTPGGATAGKGATVSLLTTGASPTILPSSFLSRTPPPGDLKPMAYINWILFDEQFKYVNGSFSRVGDGNSIKDHFTELQNITVNKNGYLYVYCSNQSPVKVFFDNLQVIHTKSPLVEETHYYPFGLTMAGISSKAAGSLENKRKWNKGSELQSNEFSDGSGLELYSTFYRSVDPQLGRFWQIDPKPDYAQSLYSSMGNNPILKNDPLGDTTIVDRRGYIVKQYGKDNLVFLQKGKKLIGIGELGKTINANKIYKNLLTKNINYAQGIVNPKTFRDLVKGRGEWDLKNNQKTIYGVANSFDKGKENKTQFAFQGQEYTAEDLGNHHYGATGNATWFGGEDFLLQQAGAAQMAAGTSKPEFQRYGKSIQYYGEQGQRYSMRGPMLPPYGDDPRDQEMIKAGVKYYNANKNTSEEED